MMRYVVFLFLLFSLVACKEKPSIKTLEKGSYRAVLKVNDKNVLPFSFEVENSKLLKIYNAEEVVIVDEIEYKNDSVYIKTPVFQGYLVAKITNEGTLEGFFVKEELNRIVPFYTIKSSKRFDTVNDAEINISGNWETVFSPDNEADRYIAKGVFTQKGNHVIGTFETTTGDYRYLEGIVDGNQLKLSTFDGAHAFLFTAKLTDSTMQGLFYSGNHWEEPFVAKRNDTYQLPNANDLTYLKPGYDKIAFAFPDADGNLVSLEDERFKDKVVLVQIMGTWCPNCLDESKYYSEFYKNNESKDLEIIALAFEYTKTEAQAFKNINRLIERVNITYPVLLAQVGSSSKVKAQEKLPMLNHVLSYPTTIFIDKKGHVRKIHTGFNGPATGEKFIKFKEEFTTFVDMLLNEN